MIKDSEPTKEQKGIWLNEFYEWYKDCFSIDGDMAKQVKTQMFADMRYAYIAAKKSDFENISNEKKQLEQELAKLKEENEKLRKLIWSAIALKLLHQPLTAYGSDWTRRAKQIIGE